MKKYSTLIFLVLLMQVFAGQLSAQEKNADLILDGVRKKFGAVKDYEAKVKIKVDVDFVKIPEKSGTVWFLQPGQVKVKTPGFSLLPKRGMNFTPNQLFNGNYTAIYAREEKLGTVLTQVIKVIPQSETDDIILSTLWIDTDRNVIRKLETTTKSEGTFAMQFFFPQQIRTHDLPDKIIFNFDIRKNELPLGLTGDFENQRPKDKKGGNSRGTVTITYLDYIVNQGKAAAIFAKKK
jgi:outer membrane lipoprotein-sorting protein